MITGQPGSRSSLPSHRTLARRWVQYDPQPIPNVASRPIWSWMAQGPFFALPHRTAISEMRCYAWENGLRHPVCIVRSCHHLARHVQGIF